MMIQSLLACLTSLDALVETGSLSHRERAQLACALALRALLALSDIGAASVLMSAAVAEEGGGEPRGFSLIQLAAAGPLAAALESGAAAGAVTAGGVAAVRTASATLLSARVAHVYGFVSDGDVRLASRQERAARGLATDGDLTFAEAPPVPLCATLRRARRAAYGNDPGGTLVDVGSGAGRALVVGALSCDFAVLRGEEILEGLHMVACEAARRCQVLVGSDAPRFARVAVALAGVVSDSSGPALAVKLCAALTLPPPPPTFLLRLGSFFETDPRAAAAELIFPGSGGSLGSGGMGACASTAPRDRATLPWPASFDVAFFHSTCFEEPSLRRVANLMGIGARDGATVISVTQPLDAYHSALAPIAAAREAFAWGEATVFIHALDRDRDKGISKAKAKATSKPGPPLPNNEGSASTSLASFDDWLEKEPISISSTSKIHLTPAQRLLQVSSAAAAASLQHTLHFHSTTTATPPRVFTGAPAPAPALPSPRKTPPPLIPPRVDRPAPRSHLAEWEIADADEYAAAVANGHGHNHGHNHGHGYAAAVPVTVTVTATPPRKAAPYFSPPSPPLTTVSPPFASSLGVKPPHSPSTSSANQERLLAAARQARAEAKVALAALKIEARELLNEVHLHVPQHFVSPPQTVCGPPRQHANMARQPGFESKSKLGAPVRGEISPPACEQPTLWLIDGSGQKGGNDSNTSGSSSSLQSTSTRSLTLSRRGVIGRRMSVNPGIWDSVEGDGGLKPAMANAQAQAQAQALPQAQPQAQPQARPQVQPQPQAPALPPRPPTIKVYPTAAPETAAVEDMTSPFGSMLLARKNAWSRSNNANNTNTNGSDSDQDSCDAELLGEALPMQPQSPKVLTLPVRRVRGGGGGGGGIAMVRIG